MNQGRTGRNLVPARSVILTEQSNIVIKPDGINENLTGCVLPSAKIPGIGSELPIASEFITSGALSVLKRKAQTMFGKNHRGLPMVTSVDSPIQKVPKLLDPAEASRMKNNLTSAMDKEAS